MVELLMTPAIEKYDSREAWLAARQRGIGASEASAIVGMSRYASAYSVWVDKTEPAKFGEMDQMQRWGLLLEPLILEEFNCHHNKHGVTAIRVAPNTIHRHPTLPFIFCSLDAQEALGPSPVQLKTAHNQAGREWTKKVPVAYMCQCQQEIAIMDADEAYIAVLIDGWDFRFHRVLRHQKFIDRLFQREEFFWTQYVEKRVAPPIDHSEATRRAIMRLYPDAKSEVVELDDEMLARANRRKELLDAIAEQQKECDTIENLIRALIGGASHARLPDGSGFSHKVNGHGTRTLRRCKKVRLEDE